MVASQPAYDAHAVDLSTLTGCAQGGDAATGCGASYNCDDTAHGVCDQLASLDLGGGRGPAAAAPKAPPHTANPNDAAGGAGPCPCPAPAPAPAAGAAGPLASLDLAGVADLIKSGRARNIVVMAGAGISVSAGIPDFRTPGTGLYSQLQKYRLPYPEAVFSIDFFRRDPKPFYTLAKELFPGGYAPTPAHFLLRLLSERGLLLRVFTQNIDGLEQLAGVPADKVVAAHGSFDSAHCVDCKRPASMYAVQAAVYDDGICACDACGGLVKPDIVFFGEPLPARFHRRRAEDMEKADLLIVMGTSLVVQPFASMIADVGPGVPRLLINRERVGHSRGAKELDARQKEREASLAAAAAAAARRAAGSSCSSSDDEEAGVDASDASERANNAVARRGEDGFDSGCESDESSGSGSSSASGLSGGFDWGLACNARDASHLGDADSAARELAALLGWSGDLDAAIKADAEARAAAAAEEAAE